MLIGGFLAYFTLREYGWQTPIVWTGMDSSCHKHQISSDTRGPNFNKPDLSDRAPTSHAGDMENKDFSKEEFLSSTPRE